MSDLAGRWIRKNKNVQVRVGENIKEKAVVFFRNGHVRYIDRKQFLDEFMSLDELLAQIPDDSNWLHIEHGYPICISNIRQRAATVVYRIKNVEESYSYGGMDIQRFIKEFRRDEQ